MRTWNFENIFNIEPKLNKLQKTEEKLSKMIQALSVVIWKESEQISPVWTTYIFWHLNVSAKVFMKMAKLCSALCQCWFWRVDSSWVRNIWSLSPLVPSKRENLVLLSFATFCIFFEGSVFIFQFLNDKIYNYVFLT